MKNIAWQLLAALLFFALTSPASAQRDLKDIPDPDPEIERKSLQIADGFEVNLFAADPLLAKPIQMNFDARGRLWIAASEVYPQILPGQKANDKILVLEDQDGDGKADKTTIFADGLLIPTGVEPGDGGAYIANSTELLFFKDTDGDGKADSKRIVLSGFGTEDTHHILHTLRWGMDGMLYMSQSIYIHSHIETPWGVKRLNGGGAWQFRPETMQLAVLYHGLVNPWGLHFDAFGATFATDGAGGEGINYIVPGAYYTTAPDAVKILAGLNPGSPKYCGLEIVGGRHLPDDWQGNFVTNDFRANRVCRFVVSDDGSGFSSRELPELIKSTHRAFRPIDVKMGPDGAIYIADWYNPIIQHGEVDFRDPRRDHVHGRIWRITAKGRKLVERPKLEAATIDELLNQFESPEPWTRHFAKRVLKERGAKAVLPKLNAWVNAPRDLDSWSRLLEALWTYQALDSPESGLLQMLLRSPDFRVRAAATRVIQHWADRLSDPLGLLSVQVADEHPRVRLEAVRVLASIPDVRSIEIAARALDRPMDKFLDYALWLTSRELQPHWLPALQAGTLNLGNDTNRLAYVLSAAGSPAVVAPILDALKSGKFAPSQQDGAINIVASLGGPKELGAIVDMAFANGTTVERRANLIGHALRATQTRGVVPEGDLNRLAPLLDAGSNDQMKMLATNVIGGWKVESLRARIEAIAADAKQAGVLRKSALQAIKDLGGSKSEGFLENASTSESSEDVRRAAIVNLAFLKLGAAAQLAARMLASSARGDGAAELVNSFLSRKGGGDELAAALRDKSLPPDVAKLALRAVRASGRPEPALTDAISKAGKINSGPLALSPEEMAKTIREVASLGDPARGELVFRRKELTCFNCHAIAGAGGQVGPSLESIGASAQVDYLIDSLLNPSTKIKENYNAFVVATNDGRVVTGVKLRQSDQNLILRDADDREVAIPVGSIEEQKDAGSLMPVGLTETLTHQELLDLVRFLSELGKPGAFAVGPSRIVRRWQTIPPDANVLAEIKRSGADAAPGTPNLAWQSAYSAVGGKLPLADLPQLRAEGSNESRSWARFQLDVTTPGRIRLGLNSPLGIAAWVDSKRIHELEEVTELELDRGQHVIMFSIDPTKRRDGLRVELLDAPGSLARASIVVGK